MNVVNVLYKMSEFENVPIAEGDPLVAGTSQEDFVISNNEIWRIARVCGSTNEEYVKLSLQYSEDAGNTYINPYDDMSSSLSIFYLTKGGLSMDHFDEDTFEFVGDGTNKIIRILIENYNTTTTINATVCIQGLKGYKN